MLKSTITTTELTPKFNPFVSFVPNATTDVITNNVIMDSSLYGIKTYDISNYSNENLDTQSNIYTTPSGNINALIGTADYFGVNFNNFAKSTTKRNRYLSTILNIKDFKKFADYSDDVNGMFMVQMDGNNYAREKTTIIVFADGIVVKQLEYASVYYYKFPKKLKLNEDIKFEILVDKQNTTNDKEDFYITINDYCFNFYTFTGNATTCSTLPVTTSKGDVLKLGKNDVIKSAKYLIEPPANLTKITPTSRYGYTTYFYMPLITGATSYSLDYNKLARAGISITDPTIITPLNTTLTNISATSLSIDINYALVYNIKLNLYNNGSYLETFTLNNPLTITRYDILTLLQNNNYLGYTSPNFIDITNVSAKVWYYQELDIDIVEQITNVTINYKDLDGTILSTETKNVNSITTKSFSAKAIEGYMCLAETLVFIKNQTTYDFIYKKLVKTINVKYKYDEVVLQEENIEFKTTEDVYIYPKEITGYKYILDKIKFDYSIANYTFKYTSLLKHITVNCYDKNDLSKLIFTKEIDTIENYIIVPQVTGYQEIEDIVYLTGDNNTITLLYTKLEPSREVTIICLDKEGKEIKRENQTIGYRESIILAPDIMGYTVIFPYVTLLDDIDEYTFNYVLSDRTISITYKDKDTLQELKNEIKVVAITTQVIVLDEITNYNFQKNLIIEPNINSYLIFAQKIVQNKIFSIKCLNENGENLANFEETYDINTVFIINSPKIEGYIAKQESKTIIEGIFEITFDYYREENTKMIIGLIQDLTNYEFDKEKILNYMGLSLYSKYNNAMAKAYIISADLLYNTISCVSGFNDGTVSISNNFSYILKKVDEYRNRAAIILAEELELTKKDNGCYLTSADGREGVDNYDNFYF